MAYNRLSAVYAFLASFAFLATPCLAQSQFPGPFPGPYPGPIPGSTPDPTPFPQPGSYPPTYPTYPGSDGASNTSLPPIQVKLRSNICGASINATCKPSARGIGGTVTAYKCITSDSNNVQGHFDLRANYDHDNGATGQLFTGIISDKGMLSALLDQAGNYYLHAAIGSKQESLCFAFDKKCKVEREQSAEIHFLNNYYSATCKSEQIWISDGIAAKWVQEVSCSEPFPGSLTIFFAEELEAKVYMPLRFMPGASFEGSASAQLHVDGVFAGLHEVDLPGFSVEMGGKVGVCWKRKVGCLDIEFGASVQGAAGYDSCKEAGYINSDVCPVFRCEFKY